MSEELEASADTVELTRELTGVPGWAMVNELQDAIILVTPDGFLHHYQRSTDGKGFVLPYPAVSVFGAQADIGLGRTWHDINNELREEKSFEPRSARPRLTAVSYLLGDDTILFGDSNGGLQSWLTLMEEDFAAGRVWKRYARVRALPAAEKAIVSISPSPITKAVVVTDESGEIRAINNTAERVYARVSTEPVKLAIFNRKGDGILAISDAGRLSHWWVDAPHSEVSFKSLFGAVWYESYPEPKYEWQSTGGTDDVEPKLSLIPLIMGTIKGALYALLFAVPLAVLAAIYTSEFMHRNMRSILKPTMEVMASLPSVVLGFLAALYFAPKAGPIMPTAICAFVIVPLVFMVFGWVWQRCPPSLVGKFGYWRSTALLFVLLAFGVWLASLVGPRAEVYLFPAVEGANPALLDPVSFQPINEQAADALAAGDFRTWPGGGQPLQRDQEVGASMLPKGWWVPGGHNLLVALLALPLVLLLGWGSKVLARRLRDTHGRTPGERLRERLEGPQHSGARALAVDIGISLVFGSLLLLAGFGLSYLVAPLIEGMFFSYNHPTAGSVADFRRWITGEQGWKFEQSNSLVVGFAMGFAVIPLIYTISEDALTTVPNQLRAASLACGASRWQTTMRIVLPTAASGIFSAIVIGLGRALGETMIVVMAAGGTPVMDMQPLNGFRSLSAAIAIEMPEAPHGGTLYRTLFLGGLVLFLMAFVINTMAEVVRMRLRRRLSRM
ncbi:MAG: ABC transporter permease subunit [Planctomycetes bacterium]|nr:ABC transporter permease subunit [Planctomycetota bacterium]